MISTYLVWYPIRGSTDFTNMNMNTWFFSWIISTDKFRALENRYTDTFKRCFNRKIEPFFSVQTPGPERSSYDLNIPQGSLKSRLFYRYCIFQLFPCQIQLGIRHRSAGCNWAFYAWIFRPIIAPFKWFGLGREPLCPPLLGTGSKS